MKILIAEDDPISRRIVRSTVERFGHECLVARDGLEAWETFDDTPDIDVVISDWMMPGIDGIELCRRVRATERPCYVFFVFLTALGNKEHLLVGMQAGADEYLTKPLDAEQLRVKLISASRVTSAHRHLNAEANAEPKPEVSNGLHAPQGSPNGGSPSKAVALRPEKRAPVGGGKVWDFLIAEGKLSESQLQQALEVQKKTPGELGKLLVSQGFITDSDLAQAQAQRLNLDFLELAETHVDRAVVGLVSERVLRKHDALPLYLEDGRLVVAMDNPTNIFALEDLKLLSGYDVVPVVVSTEDLRRTQEKVFATGEGVAEILEDAGEADAEEGVEVELGGDTRGDEAPVVRLVSSILQQAVADEASDIHLDPRPKELGVRFRVDGVLREVMSIPPKLQRGVVARLKVLANLDIAEKRIPQDGRFSVRLGGQKLDMRAASLPAVYGEEMVLRLLDTSGPAATLAGLGFRERDLKRFEEVYRRPYGTILATGPTGSGKSTTLYATLGELNTPQKKIITVEDPVERRMDGLVQMQVNPRAGLTFASGLRSILRSDPDVVMIGEIRDFETARTSVEAALTGHLVLATLHTNDAPGAVTRLVDMGVEPFLVATAVDCVVAQRLARRLCEKCKRPTEVADHVLTDLRFPFELASGTDLRFHKAVGCDRCGGTGYRGRVGLYELMVLDDAARDAVLGRAAATEVARAAEKAGMTRLREDGLLKAAHGMTTVEEVLRTVV